ncbi:MAG: CpcT/CpeT family chromophore lyase [Phycisphaera sp.]|nr:MAG: CpcT/CpeT family chromophore lyase [Phycisphaera sp.]
MDRRLFVTVIALLAAVLAPAGVSRAQEVNTPPIEPSIFADPSAGQMGDPDIARLTSMLEGSWRTVDPAGGEDATKLWAHMVPFETELLGRAMYVEVHRDGTPWEPVKQAIYRVYRFGDTLRLRTYEFREADRPGVLANLWLAPKDMPVDTIRPDELIATMDLEFERATNGYAGETPHAYPTREHGSVEMTSSLRVRPDRLVSEDTFYGLDGAALESAGGELTWERTQFPATVQTDEDGLVIITLEEGVTDGPPTDEGDIVFLNFEVWRTDGTLFDSTWEDGLTMRTMYPLRVVGGFKNGIEPLVEGLRRKLIIPPKLGFGNVEMQNLPPNSTLVFHIHVVKVEQSDPISQEERTKRQEQP